MDIVKLHYSIEPRDRRYVKGYGFLSFVRNIGKNISNKYIQELVDSAKKSATNAIKTASKRAIQKTAEEAGDLSGNKIADKITCTSKKSKSCTQMKLIMKYQKKYIYPQERQQIIDE